MLKVPQNASEKIQKEREKEAWAIYEKARQGEDFAALAKQYSEDYSCSEQGGRLPWLSTGQIIPSFEKAAFALNEIGEITEPVRTEFGWHIIKLLDVKTPDSYEKMHDLIVRRMARDERADAGQKMYIENLKKEKDFVWNDTVIIRLEKAVADTAALKSLLQMEQPLFFFNGKPYPVSKLVSYIDADNTSAMSISALRTAADEYVNDVLVAYQVDELSRTNADFRYLLQEYHDGMLLFEVSNREVWNKAMEDEKGLQKYFRKNKKKYTWDTPRYKGYVITGDNAETVAAVKSFVTDTDLPFDSVMTRINKQYNDSVTHVKIEKGLYQKGMNAVVDRLAFGVESADTTTTALPVEDLCGKVITRPEVYEDVKGLVISDYQNYLEEKWVRKLRKKYPVTLRKDVLATVKPISE